MDDKNETADNDFEMARRIKHDLLVKGSEALEDMIEVAKSTEHPRAYEVLSGMIKNVGEVSDSLMDIHKKKKDIYRTSAGFLVDLWKSRRIISVIDGCL